MVLCHLDMTSSIWWENMKTPWYSTWRLLIITTQIAKHKMIWIIHVVNFKSKTSTHTIKNHILIRILSCPSTLATTRTPVLLLPMIWAARRVNLAEVLRALLALLLMPRTGKPSFTSCQRDIRCSTSTPWRRQRIWCAWSLICKTWTSITTRKQVLKNKKPFYWTGGSESLTRIIQTRRFNTDSMRRFMAKICSRRINQYYHLTLMERRSSKASRIGSSAWRVHLKRPLRGITQRFSLHSIFKIIKKNWLNSIWITLINSTKDSLDLGSPKPKSHSWSNCATSRTSQLLSRSRCPFWMSFQIWCQTSTRSCSRISSSTSSSFALTCLWVTSTNFRPRRSMTSTTTSWPRAFSRQLKSILSQTTRKGYSLRAKLLIWLLLARLFSTCSVNSKLCKVSSRTASNRKNKRTRIKKNVHSILKMKYLAKWLKTKAKMHKPKTWHRPHRRATQVAPPFSLATCMLRIEFTRFLNNQIIN